KAGHRNKDRQLEFRNFGTRPSFRPSHALPGHFVVHEAADLRNRRDLVEEVRKPRTDITTLGTQQAQHFPRHVAKQGGRHWLATVGLQQRDETRHMGAFFVRRQSDSQFPISHCGLVLHTRRNQHGVPDAAHTHSLNGDAARIDAALHIRHGDDRICDGIHFGSLFPQGFCPPSCTTLLTVPKRFPQRCRTVFRMPAASRPSPLRRAACSPWSMKRSGSPNCNTGMTISRAFRHSCTALPAPPMIAPSSMVTDASCVEANSCPRASSRGLTKRMSTTVASSSSPASSAAVSKVPNARMARPLPSRLTTALPSGTVSSPATTEAPRPAPRG